MKTTYLLLILLFIFIRRLIPDPASADPAAPQGWRKMFYINPHDYLTDTATGARHGQTHSGG
ncbi:MAG: hypothetical protein R3E89_17965 [Thiolinea sp.]